MKTQISRDGIDKLMKYLDESDFYIAPASARFHGNYEGGLVEHSLNVYERLLNLYINEYGMPDEERLETLTIVSLFHDLCKVNFYRKDFRNVKNEDGKWEKQPCYTIDEKFPMGYHGCKSAFIIERYIKLTPEEYTAVACHMGAYDRPNGDYTIGNAFEHNTLAFLLHTADCMATFIDEPKKKEG